MSMNNSFHRSVLVPEVLNTLRVKRAGVYVDATVGDGGHTLALLQRLDPDQGFVYGIDQDPMAVRIAASRLQRAGFDNFRLIRYNFCDMTSCFARLGVTAVDGIIFDLGLSQRQLDDERRGFSYHHDGPLDMRIDPSAAVTAAAVLAQSTEQQLANMLSDYGELRYARRLARSIVRARCDHKIVTTQQLVSIIKHTAPSRCRRVGHPARRLFQALRIAVNRELTTLRHGLIAAAHLLQAGGRLVVISFHSLEDRIVKHYFRALAGRDATEKLLTRDLPTTTAGAPVRFRLVTNRPVTASHRQVLGNRRSRSAKLRAIERL